MALRGATGPAPCEQSVHPLVFALLGVFGVVSPGVTMAFGPQPFPGLHTLGCLVSQEVVHGTRTAPQHRDQTTAFGLIETVGVGEDSQSARRVRALPVRMRGQRDEPVNGVGDVPQARAGTCTVPVDEGPPRLVCDHEARGPGRYGR